MAKRKAGNSHTTICVTWEDKEMFRKFAKYVKKTKNGDMYESDAAVFHRMLESFSQSNQANDQGHETYPRKPSPQERVQLD